MEKFGAFAHAMVAWWTALFAWSLASPTNAGFVLGVIGLVTNVYVRVKTSKRWELWCLAHPHVVGVFLFLKALFPDVGGMWNSLWIAFTGKLEKRAKESS